MNIGLQPLKLDSLEEQEHFFRVVNEGADFKYDNYWHIGGRKNENDDWIWVPQSNIISYNMEWADGEPNNYKNYEHYLGIRQGVYRVGFNDLNCDGDKRGFFCQATNKNYEDHENHSQYLTKFNELLDEFKSLLKDLKKMIYSSNESEYSNEVDYFN